MALILAVEPDRRQASHIVAVLRGRPRTELIIAESAAAAIQAIAKRVPDLLLTSPLLSRQDESRLAEWLGGLGAAAAHVQALTIPILATAAPETTRGMLSMLRRRSPRTSNPAGCEPAMFASQVGLYLERSSVNREDEPAATVPPEPPPVPALEWAAAIECDPEPAIAQIDIAESNRIEAEFALPSLSADEESSWVAGPLDDVREAAARVPEPAPAEPVTHDGWMLTAGPAVDELLIPIYDLPPEPVVETIFAPVVEIEAPAREVMAAALEAVATPAIEADPEPAIAAIDIAVSGWIEAEIAMASLPADESSRWVGVPVDEMQEEPADVPEPATAELVTDGLWMLTPGPAVDELVTAAPPDSPETAEFMLLTPIYDLPAELIDEVCEEPAPATAELVTDGLWMLTPGPVADELVAAAPPDSPQTAAFMLLTPIYDLPAELVVEAVSAPAAELEAPPIEVEAPALEVVAAPAIEPDPEPAMAAIDTAVSSRIEAEIVLALLPADQDLLWVAAPVDEVREEPARVPEPATAEPVTDGLWMLTPGPAADELVAAAPPDSPETASFMLLTPIYDLPAELVVEASVSAPAVDVEAPARDVVAAALEVVAAPAIEPDPEPAMAAIDTAVSNQIAAAIALAALRAHEEAQWLAVPLEGPEEAAVALPGPAPAWPVTDDVWMLASVPAVEELVAAPLADPPYTAYIAPTILLTTIYDPPLQPTVEAMVAAPIPKVVKAPSPATTRRRKVEKPKKKPIQDEWGFFDPGQCGFAALLDKLDEITAQEEANGVRRDDVEVRVITY